MKKNIVNALYSGFMFSRKEEPKINNLHIEALK